MRFIINLLFSIATIFGKLFCIPYERIAKRFIEINNHLVNRKNGKIFPKDILLLIPHCLQDFDCEVRITNRIRNCKGCGRCEIKELIELSCKFRVNIEVATGGGFARKILKTYNPKAVVAIACERELATGICDTYPLPVFGILNERPDGPCKNTRVKLDKVDQAINRFLTN
ncbi:MAG: DUF116 domain-containing protein [bacterium]|nr:DUF116 domain-containing protein [bacterium]